MLNVTREPGLYGLAPIQLSEIRAAADLYGITNLDEREELLRTMVTVDAEYRAMVVKLQKEEVEEEKRKQGVKASGSRSSRHSN